MNGHTPAVSSVSILFSVFLVSFFTVSCGLRYDTHHLLASCVLYKESPARQEMRNTVEKSVSLYLLLLALSSLGESV